MPFLRTNLHSKFPIKKHPLQKGHRKPTNQEFDKESIPKAFHQLVLMTNMPFTIGPENNY